MALERTDTYQWHHEPRPVEGAVTQWTSIGDVDVVITTNRDDDGAWRYVATATIQNVVVNRIPVATAELIAVYIERDGALLKSGNHYATGMRDVPANRLAMPLPDRVRRRLYDNLQYAISTLLIGENVDDQQRICRVYRNRARLAEAERIEHQVEQLTLRRLALRREMEVVK